MLGPAVCGETVLGPLLWRRHNCKDDLWTPITLFLQRRVGCLRTMITLFRTELEGLYKKSHLLFLRKLWLSHFPVF